MCNYFPISPDICTMDTHHKYEDGQGSPKHDIPPVVRSNSTNCEPGHPPECRKFIMSLLSLPVVD